MEFPPIGCPVMVERGTFRVIDYKDTPPEFWEAVKDFQSNP